MDIIGKGKIFGIISIILVLASMVLVVTPGVKLGIDFKSGTTITYQIDGVETDASTIREAIAGAGHNEAVVQGIGQNQYLVRLNEIGENEKPAIDRAVQDAVGVEPTALDVTTVGRSVASDTIRNAITAVIVASVFIMLYIVYAFRSVPHSYRYAIAAIVALIHDVFICLGVFVVLGQLIGTEVNAIFIVGILTVIGYSVNDTIVIFDRLRENTQVSRNRSFSVMVNESLNETMARSLGTSFTTSVVIFAMLLFGGDTLQDFLIILLAGVIVGTYSSIFVASNMLVSWEVGTLGRLIDIPVRRFRKQQAEPA